MIPNSERPTATIYQFPIGGRRNFEDRWSTKAAETVPEVYVDIGASWYHAAAIEESKPRSDR